MATHVEPVGEDNVAHMSRLELGRGVPFSRLFHISRLQYFSPKTVLGYACAEMRKRNYKRNFFYKVLHQLIKETIGCDDYYLL